LIIYIESTPLTPGPYNISQLPGAKPAPLIPLAASLCRQLTRASNLLESDAWIISILEPVKPPPASRLEFIREAIALRALRDAAVLRTPAIGRSAPLCGACVVNTNTATGHSDVEVIVSEVATRIGGLHDHLLATDGAGCERQSNHRCQSLRLYVSERLQDILIAGTAPVALRLVSKLDSCKPIRKAIVDRPGRLVGAHEGRATALAAVLRSHVGERVVALVAALDGLIHVGLAGPSAGAFAAVPVTGRHSICGVDGCEAGGEGKEGELLDGYHVGRVLVFLCGSGRIDGWDSELMNLDGAGIYILIRFPDVRL
jgi:hypothetical protein